MDTYPDIPSFFAEQGPEHIERFVRLNLDISQRGYALMQERSGVVLMISGFGR